MYVRKQLKVKMIHFLEFLLKERPEFLLNNQRDVSMVLRKSS